MRFNPSFAALALAASVAVASFGAQASSIEVKVIGTITPGACTPTLAGGGTIDYGSIGAAEVSQANFTVLPEKTVAFTIACNAPAKVAIRAIDNHANSLVPGATQAIGSAFDDNYNLGLGTVAGANVGGYLMRMRQGSFTADNVNVFTVASLNSGTAWVGSATGGIKLNSPNLMSWSAVAGGVPIAFTNLSGNFSVQAVLNKGSALTLTSDVTLDGSATLELVYL